MGHPKHLPLLGDKEVDVNHDVLQDIARVLRKDLEGLKRDRWRERIEDDHPPIEAMGDYTAGKSLHQTIKNARDHIGTVQESFVQAYESVILALENSEKNYRDADDNSAAGLRDRTRL